MIETRGARALGRGAQPRDARAMPFRTAPTASLLGPETEEAALTLELAIPLLEEAAGRHVEGLIGDTDPLVAVRETLERQPFDEVIVSTLPARVSHWLHRDLPSRVEQLGVSVTVVTARTSSRRLLTER